MSEIENTDSGIPQTSESVEGSSADDTTLLTDSVSDESSQEKVGDAPEAEESKEEKPAVGEVPETYDIKVPEGVELDTGTLDIFSPIFKELGLTTEGAQKLVDAYVPMLQNSSDNQRQESLKAYEEIVNEWRSESLKDLGADAKTALSFCAKAREKFGSDELKEVLESTGIGNHKAMIRFMEKIGKTISEDSLVEGARRPDEKDPLKIMYPTMI